MRCFKYSNRPKSYITVTALDDPYGDASGRVISIGCTLKGDTQNPTWKVHVPIDLAESVAQEMMRLCAVARKEKQDGTRTPSRLFVDEDGKVIREEAAVKTDSIDIEAASRNAVTQGRVIKREK